MERGNMQIPGGSKWVPWMGLAMVFPAVIVLMVAAFAILFGSGMGGFSGERSSVGVSILATISVLIALFLATVGIVRAYKKPTWRSVGYEGLALEVGTLVIAVIALVSLAVLAF